MDRKDISITPTLTSIFKPTGDYLGSELKNYVQSHVEKAKEIKKSQNIEAHLEQIKTKTFDKESESVTYHQLDLFDKWVDGAAKVDPQDKILSDMWQNLLLDSKNSFNSEVILEKLKQVSSGDALALIKVYEKSHLNREERYRINKLESLGLVEKNELKTTLLQFSFMTPVLVTIFAVMISIFPTSSIISNLPSAIKIVLPFSLIILLSSVFFFVKKAKSGGFRIWQLTWLGERLIGLNK